MPDNEARVWWADVQELRERIERRRASDAGDLAAAGRARRRVEGATQDREWLRRSADPAPAPPGAAAGSPAPAHPGAPRPSGAAAGSHAPRAHRPVRSRGGGATSGALTTERGGRRTIQITGRTVPAPSLPRLVAVDRRRPSPRAIDRVGPRPDRLALWAFLLGLGLVLAALTSSSRAAVPARALPSRAHVAPARTTRAHHVARPARRLTHAGHAYALHTR
jgi:hypothetical protein